MGSPHDAYGTTVVLDYVRRIFKRIKKNGPRRDLAWVQFVNFWDLDFDGMEEAIERVPCSPPNLVFSQCTIANYESLVRLAERSRAPCSKLPVVTLDQHTKILNLSTGFDCPSHSLHIYNLNFKYNYSLNLTRLLSSPSIKKVKLSLDSDLPWGDLHDGMREYSHLLPIVSTKFKLFIPGICRTDIVVCQSANGALGGVSLLPTSRSPVRQTLIKASSKLCGRGPKQFAKSRT